MHIPEFVVEGDALKVSESYPVIIFSQQFRENEYKESEFFNNHQNTKLLLVGNSHYLHWEQAKDIAGWVIGQSLVRLGCGPGVHQRKSSLSDGYLWQVDLMSASSQFSSRYC